MAISVTASHMMLKVIGSNLKRICMFFVAKNVLSTAFNVKILSKSLIKFKKKKTYFYSFYLYGTSIVVIFFFILTFILHIIHKPLIYFTCYVLHINHLIFINLTSHFFVPRIISKHIGYMLNYLKCCS